MRRFRQGRSAGEPPAPIISGRLSMTQRIFDGLKVIDCASFIAGPAAATVMSDFGAAVIKIEPPGAGDPYRRRAVPVPGKPLNPGFILDARNKQSLARRSSARLCLLRASRMKPGLSGLPGTGTARRRYGSPAPGGSILITAAPKSDITVAAAGPAIKLAQSMTFKPSKMRCVIDNRPEIIGAGGSPADRPCRNRRIEVPAAFRGRNSARDRSRANAPENGHDVVGYKRVCPIVLVMLNVTTGRKDIAYVDRRHLIADVRHIVWPVVAETRPVELRVAAQGGEHPVGTGMVDGDAAADPRQEFQLLRVVEPVVVVGGGSQHDLVEDAAQGGGIGVGSVDKGELGAGAGVGRRIGGAQQCLYCMPQDIVSHAVAKEVERLFAMLLFGQAVDVALQGAQRSRDRQARRRGRTAVVLVVDVGQRAEREGLPRWPCEHEHRHVEASRRIEFTDPSGAARGTVELVAEAMDECKGRFAVRHHCRSNGVKDRVATEHRRAKTRRTHKLLGGDR